MMALINNRDFFEKVTRFLVEKQNVLDERMVHPKSDAVIWTPYGASLISLMGVHVSINIWVSDSVYPSILKTLKLFLTFGKT